MNSDEEVSKRLERLEAQMGAKPEGGAYPGRGYEYKSKAKIFGIPLITWHRASIPEPAAFW